MPIRAFAFLTGTCELVTPALLKSSKAKGINYSPTFVVPETTKFTENHNYEENRAHLDIDTAVGVVKGNDSGPISLPITPETTNVIDNDNNKENRAYLDMDTAVGVVKGNDSKKIDGCPFCDQIFSAKSTVIKHAANIHKQVLLQRNVKLAAGAKDRLYKCPENPKVYKAKCKVIQHATKHHSITLPVNEVDEVNELGEIITELQ